MPKVVVDDYGGKRTDPGMLGHGIYFANSARCVLNHNDNVLKTHTVMMMVNFNDFLASYFVVIHKFDRGYFCNFL